jgi:hypothetical protein
MNDATQTLEPFVGQWAVLLTTYKRDGTPVGTAVNIAVEGIVPTSVPGTRRGS